MEDKLLLMFQDIDVINHYGITTKHPRDKWVMAQSVMEGGKVEFEKIKIEGGAIFHRHNGKGIVQYLGCNAVTTLPIVTIVVSQSCIYTIYERIKKVCTPKAVSFDTDKNIKIELNNESEKLINYNCLYIEHEIKI